VLADKGAYLKLIQTLNHIGVQLSSETDPSRLLKKMLSGAMEMTSADAGTFYLVKDDKLVFHIIANKTLNISPMLAQEANLTVPAIPLYLKKERNLNNIASSAYHFNTSLRISDIYQKAVYDFSETKKYDEKFAYRSQSFLCIPLKDHQNKILGILQLINATDEATHQIIPFDDEHIACVESLASQAAILITKEQLLIAEEKLLETVKESSKFVIFIVSCLCLYSFSLTTIYALFKQLRLNVLVDSLALFAMFIPCFLYIMHSSLVRFSFKRIFWNWKKDLYQSILWVLPVLFLITMIKWISISYVPAFKNFNLFNGGLLLTSHVSVYGLLVLYILSCPIQEYIARGILQTTLQKVLSFHSVPYSILASSLIFSTMHLHLSLTYAFSTFFLGLFLGWLYYKQQSLLGPIIAHILIGTWSIYVLGLYGFLLA